MALLSIWRYLISATMWPQACVPNDGGIGLNDVTSVSSCRPQSPIPTTARGELHVGETLLAQRQRTRERPEERRASSSCAVAAVRMYEMS